MLSEDPSNRPKAAKLFDRIKGHIQSWGSCCMTTLESLAGKDGEDDRLENADREDDSRGWEDDLWQ